MGMNELLFTPAAVLDLLAQIDELKDVDLGIVETLDGNMQLQVGDSYYNIQPDQETEISVSVDDLEEVEDANTQAYENLDVEVSNEVESIESGLLKEAAKAMLLGGMIKLSANMLRK